MNVVIRILRYLKSSPRKGIIFTKGDNLDIKGYTDAECLGQLRMEVLRIDISHLYYEVI